MSLPDWNQLRGFLAAAEAGTFTGGARRLGLTQPTLSRQVAALEAALGVVLFERVGRTLVLTDVGLDLLEHARVMGAAADAIGLAATGHSEGVEGHVSLSASDMICAYVLPPIVAELREVAPRVTLEIVSTNAISDLQRREADLAIRHLRPEGAELIGKWIREATAHLYAADSWIAAHGVPETVDDLRAADFVGYDRGGRLVDHLIAAGLPITGENFPLLSANSVVAWALVARGLGVGVMMTEIGDALPGIQRLLPDFVVATFPIWLVTHRELGTSRRIRVVFDHLASALAAPAGGLGALDGPAQSAR